MIWEKPVRVLFKFIKVTHRGNKMHTHTHIHTATCKKHGWIWESHLHGSCVAWVHPGSRHPVLSPTLGEAGPVQGEMIRAETVALGICWNICQSSWHWRGNGLCTPHLITGVGGPQMGSPDQHPLGSTGNTNSQASPQTHWIWSSGWRWATCGLTRPPADPNGVPVWEPPN